MTFNAKLRETLLPLVLLVAASNAMGNPTIPAGLNPGDQYRLVFVSQAGISPPTSSDIHDYNALIDGWGDAVIQSNWTAILSTSTVDAIDNTNTRSTDLSVPIYNMAGELVASSNSDLWDGSLTNPIKYDEYMNPVSNSEVWTGTSSSGYSSGASFGGSSPYWTVGISDLTDYRWMNVYLQFPDRYGLHLYGMSSVFTVPTATSVPESSSASTLLFLALIGLGSLRRRLR